MNTNGRIHNGDRIGSTDDNPAQRQLTIYMKTAVRPYIFVTFLIIKVVGGKENKKRKTKIGDHASAELSGIGINGVSRNSRLGHDQEIFFKINLKKRGNMKYSFVH